MVLLGVRHLPSWTEEPAAKSSRLPQIRIPPGSQLAGADRRGLRAKERGGGRSPRKAPREGGRPRRRRSDAAIRLTRVPHGRSTRLLYAAPLAGARVCFVAAPTGRGILAAAQRGPSRPLFRRDVNGLSWWPCIAVGSTGRWHLAVRLDASGNSARRLFVARRSRTESSEIACSDPQHLQ